jgi:hypothetical protein
MVAPLRKELHDLNITAAAAGNATSMAKIKPASRDKQRIEMCIDHEPW